MIKLVVNRLIQTTFTLIILVSATFFLLRLLPGSPFDSETALAPEVRASLEKRYHMDKPVFEQYFVYLKSLGVGDLGESLTYLDQNVNQILKDTLPVTLKLGIWSLIFGVSFGLVSGLLAARWHNTWIDRLTMFIAVAGVSVPSFLLAPLLILIFSFWLDWLPPALWEGPQYYILPVVTLGIRPAAIIARLVRATALEIVHQDFIRTAEAKGLRESKVLFKHVLKNSLIPVLGVLGSIVAGILSGSFIVEVLFAIPGLGHHLIESVTNRDYPLVLALTILYGVLLAVSNLIMDIFSMFVDPRVQIT